MRRLSLDQARRMALGAQGFAMSRPGGGVDRRHFRRLFRTIGLLQLDSVNVVARSHYLPVLARLGAYDKARLDAFTTDPAETFEYWGHAASLLPSSTYPLWRFRREGMKPWQRIADLEEEHPGYVESVYDEIAAHGPLSVSDLADPGTRTGSWWGHGRGKIALEWLFATGRITALRNGNFARLYDIVERVIPHDFLYAEPVPKEQAYRGLLLMGARHHGVGTASDIADYYRLHGPTARPIIDALADEGELTRVEVAGWNGPVYAHPEATLPRRIRGAALLSPFDPVVWERDRAERLFGFHYRIEIYVPEPKRTFGYYVLPFLLDGELVGRVDLKADRKHAQLRVQGSYAEGGQDLRRVAGAMAGELRLLAIWLGLEHVSVVRKGNLAATLHDVL